MSEPRKGQIRQRASVETPPGTGLQHLVDVTTEAWTGTEWVDVRALVAWWNVHTQPEATP